MLTITLKDTEGVKQVLAVKPVNPKIKTLKGGKSYEAGHLFELAKEGKLSEEATKASPALVSMTQAQAVDIILDAFKNSSVNIEVVDVPEAKDPKTTKKAATEETPVA